MHPPDICRVNAPHLDPSIRFLKGKKNANNYCKKKKKNGRQEPTQGLFPAGGHLQNWEEEAHPFNTALGRQRQVGLYELKASFPSHSEIQKARAT